MKFIYLCCLVLLVMTLPARSNSDALTTASADIGISPYVPPVPPNGLPNPYQGADFKARNSNEQGYVNYLSETPLIPNRTLCESNLRQRLKGFVFADGISLHWEWVTPPYMAWGGSTKTDAAVVGPVEYLFTLMEAHVDYLDTAGQPVKQTYSCYVQYANLKEERAWQSRVLRHGSCLKTGHLENISCPAKYFSWGVPGVEVTFSKVIRYYRKD